MENGTGKLLSSDTYEAFDGWVARSIAAGADNTLLTLWNYTDGTQDVWHNHNGTITGLLYGPF